MPDFKKGQCVKSNFGWMYGDDAGDWADLAGCPIEATLTLARLFPCAGTKVYTIDN